MPRTALMEDATPSDRRQGIAATSRPGCGVAQRRSAGCLLIVEDDPHLGLLVEEFLKASGFEVTREVRGDRAVARVLAELPEVLLLDLDLPGTGGLEVCSRLRSRGYRGGILMVTGRCGEADQIQGLRRGADGYLTKPVRPELLLARVSSLIRRLRLDHHEGR